MSRSGRAAVVDDAAVGVPASVSAALGQEIDGLGERARRWPGERRSRAIRRTSTSPPPPRGWASEQALAALEELVARDVLRATDGAAALRVPPSDRAPRRLRGGGRGVAARRARARRRGARGAPERDRGARAPRRALARASGDEAAAAILEQAAHQAAARAPAVAARWLSAALRLLPDRPEGDAERRLGLLVAARDARWRPTGRLEEALDTLLQTLEQIPPELADLRVRLVAACASCENALGRHDAAHARLLHALDGVPRRRQRRRRGPAGRARRRRALRQRLRRDAAMGRSGRRRRRRRSAIPGLLAVAQALVCFAEYALGGAAQAEPARVASAAGLDALPDELLAARLDLPYYLGFAEYFCERYEDAARHLRRGIALARAVGQGQFVVPMMVGLAQALERLGRLREALNTAEAAVEASRLSGNRQAVGLRARRRGVDRGGAG